MPASELADLAKAPFTPLSADSRGILDFGMIDAVKSLIQPRARWLSARGEGGIGFKGAAGTAQQRTSNDCGLGYVVSPCTQAEAGRALAGDMALFTSSHGWCELVPFVQMPRAVRNGIPFEPFPEPDDALLLLAQLHRENRLSRAEILHAWRVFKAHPRKPGGKRLLGRLLSSYPMLYRCKGIVLSPAQLRGEKDIPWPGTA